MASMITKSINVNVVAINGRLVGLTVSDRWNLEAAGMASADVTSKASMTATRKAMRDLGLVLQVQAGDKAIVAQASKTERASLTKSIIGRINRVLKLVA